MRAGVGPTAADGWLLVPLGFQLAVVVAFFGGLLTEQLNPKAAPGDRATPSAARAVALLPVCHGMFCLVFLLFGGSDFRWAYAVLAAAAALFLVAFLTKWFRERSAVRR